MKYLLIILLCFSCAQVEKKSYQTEKLSKTLSIKTKYFLSLFPKKSQITQLVTYKKGDDVKRTQVVFKRNEDLRVTVLSPMGIELISLRVTNDGIEKISGINQFKIEFFGRVMADMLAVYASKKILLASIQGEINIKDTVSRREIISEDISLIKIDYGTKRDWSSDIELNHLEQNYKLNIKTLSLENENIY